MTSFAAFRNFLKEHIFKYLTSKVALIVVIILCIAALMYQYFRRDDAVSLMTIAGAVVVPFQEGVNGIGSFLYKNEQEKLTLDEQKAEIEALKKENAELRRELDDIQSLKLENEELRRLLSAADRFSDYEMEEAKIIGSDGVNSFERFTINKGSANGMKLNMNVINDDGLIGYISYVGLNYAIVTSIIEDGINVSAMTKNGHENCIVSGDLSKSGTGYLCLENALSDIDFESDGTLVTSDISDKFLPGLLIGYAEAMTENPGSLTQSGLVRSAVDFTRLNEVLVITTMKEERKEVTE